ncbi:MAG: nucleotidyltransferase, partial [Verrucomicrobia bacterium]|nr:nucleotidyltransferase [Verrucomicrobiota bacterium]
IIREDFAEAFKQSVGARFADRIQVDYVFQKLSDLPAGFSVPDGREKPWGTAHAVRAARDAVKEPFAVINADDFYGRDAYARAAEFLIKEASNPDAMAMVGYPLENTLSDYGTVNRGICKLDASGALAEVEEYVNIGREDDGHVRGVGLNGEHRGIPTESPVSMNFWAFNPVFFAQLEEAFVQFMTESGTLPKSECYIPTVVDQLIHGGKARCAVLQSTGSWFGVTYPDDKAFVVDSIQKAIAAGEYPEKLS